MSFDMSLIIRSVSLFGMLKNIEKTATPRTNSTINDLKKVIQQSNRDLKNQINLEMSKTNKQKYIFHNPEHPANQLIKPSNEDQSLSHQLQFNPLKNKSNQKRLTLRDYLQLNSLEKKAYGLNSTKNSKFQISGESSMIKSSMILERGNKKNLQFLPQQPKSVISHSQFLKTQITIKINEEIKKLQDIASFINNDDNSSQSEIQYEIFLCSIHSMLQKNTQINKQIGQKLLERQENSTHNRANNKPSQRYFWNREEKILCSPAKIEKNQVNLSVSEEQVKKTRLRKI